MHISLHCCIVTLPRISSGGGVEVTEGPSVIMEGAVGAGEEGLSDDEEQFVVQDSAPLELPDTDAFQPTTQQDKPEGEYVHLLNYTTRRLFSG